MTIFVVCEKCGEYLNRDGECENCKINNYNEERIMVDNWSLKEEIFLTYGKIGYIKEDIDILRKKLIEDLERRHAYEKHYGGERLHDEDEIIDIINRRFGVI